MTPALLNVPGIQFTKIKPYQHRIKERRNAGYHSTITSNGHIHTYKRRYTMVKVSRGWRIGFKNMSNVPVDIIMAFSVHDQYGQLENFAQVYRNLRPGEPAEIFIDIKDKKANIMLELVEVLDHANGQQLSSTVVRQFMPRLGWGMKTWVIPLIMAIFTAMALLDPNPNLASMLLPFLALFIMGAGLLHWTPVFIMLFLLLLVPLSSHSPGVKTTITLMGLLYFYLVWRKRHSFRDFLRAGATASK